VPNLYVVDGSVFPSSSEKNPTLTIMALAARAADHISDCFKQGDI
jgi:choline dehydrogenase-like flavoprotein